MPTVARGRAMAKMGVTVGWRMPLCATLVGRVGVWVRGLRVCPVVGACNALQGRLGALLYVCNSYICNRLAHKETRMGQVRVKVGVWALLLLD